MLLVKESKRDEINDAPRSALCRTRQEVHPVHAPHVMLLLETARSFDREFLGGVARYARKHGPWGFQISAGESEQVMSGARPWGADGIIARISDRHMAETILKSRVPTIMLGSSDERLLPEGSLISLVDVSSNAEQVAQLAVDYFLRRRLRGFAYVGVEGRSWSRRRCEAFVTQLGAKGLEVCVFQRPRCEAAWETELQEIAKWLLTLPQPVGLFACDDDRGRLVVEACRAAGLRVPEDVAVLGVDNDAVFCELSDPPLSSIALNAESAGYRAAELLDDMMNGHTRASREIRVQAVRVVTRRSTEVVAVDDTEVSAALKIIHQHHGSTNVKDMRVMDVVNELSVSRRSLEKRFKSLMGRTLLDEIQLVRLDHAKRLLLETTHPVATIAKMSGFGNVPYFCKFFNERTGMTPRRFRVRWTA
jgi:LacI family transcriptional regulator